MRCSIVLVSILLGLTVVLGDTPKRERDWNKIRWREPIPRKMEEIFRRKNFSAAGLPTDGRIIGGEEAPVGAYPHQVALFIDIFYFCGGSLLNTLYVLTAAHCTYGAYEVEVLLGAHNIRLGEEDGRLELVSPYANLIVHQGYDPYEITNDISLIMLPRRITYTDRIQPIRLPTRTEGLDTLEDLQVLISGWGRDSDSASGISAVLRYTELKVQPKVICRHFFSDLILESNICGDTRRGQGTCSGDSGGPLVRKTSDGGQYVVGVTSFGSSIGCVDPGWPSVFTFIPSYFNWIRDNSDIIINN